MTETTNPANKFGNTKSAAERKRIPMSTPQRRLEVPPLDGYHLYWFLESRVDRAIQGGYEFVDAKEIALNARNVGTAAGVSGNQDMGSRVSVVSGTGQDGQPERLYLMKIKQEWFEEDQKLLSDRNRQIEDTIRRGNQSGSGDESASDRANRYVDKSRSSLKTPFRKS